MVHPPVLPQGLQKLIREAPGFILMDLEERDRRVKLNRSASKSIFPGRRLRLGPKIEPRRRSPLACLRHQTGSGQVLILTRGIAIGHLATVTAPESRVGNGIPAWITCPRNRAFAEYRR
jgi:hypothetical protein